MNARPIVLATALTLLLAGCSQTATTTPEPVVVNQVRLVTFAQGAMNTTEGEGVSRATSWDEEVHQEPVPERADPADYGANSDGARWVDGIIQAKTYHLATDAKIATHTHGIVIYAQEITIDGTITVHNQGAPPGETGYAETRAAKMALYSGYGETDQDTGEPRLWGAGSTTKDCESPGGGYIVLNARNIILNGELDAGSDCGQAGIVILEGPVTGTGTITASLIIHRGAA